jgi:hypothetical protein
MASGLGREVVVLHRHRISTALYFKEYTYLFLLMVSFETVPRAHGWLICTGLTIEIFLFSGSLHLLIAAHNAGFLFLHVIAS